MGDAKEKPVSDAKMFAQIKKKYFKGKSTDEIYKFSPSEIICNEAFYMSGMDLDAMRDKLGITIYSLDSWYFDDAVCKESCLSISK